LFVCVAVLLFAALTTLPLFWLRAPWLRSATLAPLATTGVEVPVWFAEFSAQFDWSADCVTLPAPQQPEPPPVTVCV
jgi:hypothetical protein